MTPDTFPRIRRIVAEHRGIPEVTISGGSRLREDLDIDSLSATEIVFELEEAFGVVVPEDVVHTFLTVDDVVAAVDALLAKP